MNVYAVAEGRLRKLLSHRRSDFREKCVQVAMWLLRTHGPHGCREFPLPRQNGGRSHPLQEKLGVGVGTFQRAIEALVGIGLLDRLSGGKDSDNPRWKDPPVIYRIATTFQTLFPVAKELARRASTSELSEGRRFTSDHRKDSRDIILAPLVVNTCNTVTSRQPAYVITKDHPLGRPVLWKHPKTEKSLHAAKLEALRGLPLPKLSLRALATTKAALGLP